MRIPIPRPEELDAEFGPAIRDIVLDMNDHKTLPKQGCKQKQIEHAAHASDIAKLVNLADMIANLRDVAESRPLGWSLDRRREYFDWGEQVIEQIRGVHPGLKALFDTTYASRP